VDQEHKFRLLMRVIEATVSISKYGAWLLGIWITAHYIVEAITVLSGKQTDASVVVNLLLNVKADRWIAYILAGSGIAYGINERRLKRNDIERLTRHTDELERRIDPHRTSSRLRPDGTTRREDT
jgi:hypothetical protein